MGGKGHLLISKRASFLTRPGPWPTLPARAGGKEGRLQVQGQSEWEDLRGLFSWSLVRSLGWWDLSQLLSWLVFASTLNPSSFSGLAGPPHKPSSDCFPVLASLTSDTNLPPPAWYILGTGSAFPGPTSALLTPPASVPPTLTPESHASVCLALTFPVTSPQLSPLCLFLSLPLSLSLSCFVSGCSCLLFFPCLLFLFSPYLFLSLCLCGALSVCFCLQVSLP